MKLPLNSLIAPEKLTRYLLVFNEHSDKSAFPAKGGYTLDNWQELEADLRALLAEEAVFSRADAFGAYFEITGRLRGSIWAKTIWLHEAGSDLVRFITLIPQPRRNEI